MSKVLMWNDSHEDQRISYSVSPKEGCLLSLSGIGQQMKALARALEAMDRAFDPQIQHRCFLAGIDMAENGTITFDVLLCPRSRRAALADTDQG